MRLLLYNLRYGSGTGTRFHLPFPMAGYLLPTRLRASDMPHGEPVQAREWICSRRALRAPFAASQAAWRPDLVYPLLVFATRLL